MIYREQRLTEVVRQYDKDLFVKNGHVIRKKTRWDQYQFDGYVMSCSRVEHMQILPLTHDWTNKGQFVDWGIEPLMEKLKSIDCARDDRFIGEILEGYVTKKVESEKELSRKAQDFAKYELAPALRHDFKDHNLASVDKYDYAKKMKGQL